MLTNKFENRKRGNTNERMLHHNVVTQVNQFIAPK